jgi:hypothetical protein
MESLKKIPVILGYKLDLKSSYPNRSKFYATEILSSLGFVAVYRKEKRAFAVNSVFDSL